MALTLTDEQSTELLDTLGLPADTTDPALVLDTVKDLAAQAEGVDPAKPSTVAAAAAKAGLEVLDAATVAALRHDAAQGRQLAAAAAHAKVEASVDDAIAKGKISRPPPCSWVPNGRKKLGSRIWSSASLAMRSRKMLGCLRATSTVNDRSVRAGSSGLVTAWVPFSTRRFERQRCRRRRSRRNPRRYRRLSWSRCRSRRLALRRRRRSRPWR